MVRKKKNCLSIFASFEVAGTSANVERICDEAVLAFLSLHFRSFVDYCFTVER
jgi:hypothetical protein